MLASTAPRTAPRRRAGARDVAFEMYAESEAARRAWVATLEYVVAVADARKRWLERASADENATRDGVPSPEEATLARQREREEARKRMLAAMGGDSAQLRSGAGVAFGFGGELR